MAQSKYDEKLIELDRQAVEDEYNAAVRGLFRVWLHNTISGQPVKAGKGAEIARKAYIEAMDAIDRREQELKRRRGQ
jgi:hypothetical protein